MRKLDLKYKVVIYIFIILTIVLIIGYTNIVNNKIKRNEFADNMIEILSKNEEAIFSVNRIDLFSSANVIDNSINKNLENLDIYQYADISLYINNRSKIKELTKENTIKELYIDNIDFNFDSQIGDRSLYYTNSLKFSENTGIEKHIKTDRIDFDILYTNEQNKNATYIEPTFYTDCSNPITLKDLNKDLVKGFNIGEGKKVDFDGKLLKEAKVSKQDIKCKIKFKINLVNNNDKKFSCWINLDIPIEELYNDGKSKKIAENIKYDFFAM